MLNPQTMLQSEQYGTSQWPMGAQNHPLQSQKYSVLQQTGLMGDMNFVGNVQFMTIPTFDFPCNTIADYSWAASQLVTPQQSVMSQLFPQTSMTQTCPMVSQMTPPMVSQMSPPHMLYSVPSHLSPQMMSTSPMSVSQTPTLPSQAYQTFPEMSPSPVSQTYPETSTQMVNPLNYTFPMSASAEQNFFFTDCISDPEPKYSHYGVNQSGYNCHGQQISPASSICSESTHTAHQKQKKYGYRTKQKKIDRAFQSLNKKLRSWGVLADEKELVRGPTTVRVHIKKFSGLGKIHKVMIEINDVVQIQRVAVVLSRKNKDQYKGFIIYLRVASEQQRKYVQSIFHRHKEWKDDCKVALPKNRPTSELQPPKMPKRHSGEAA